MNWIEILFSQQSMKQFKRKRCEKQLQLQWIISRKCNNSSLHKLSYTLKLQSSSPSCTSFYCTNSINVIISITIIVISEQNNWFAKNESILNAYMKIQIFNAKQQSLVSKKIIIKTQSKSIRGNINVYSNIYESQTKLNWQRNVWRAVRMLDVATCI